MPKAIHTVFDGNVFLGKSSGRKLIEELKRPKEKELTLSQTQKDKLKRRLSAREAEMLKLIGAGKSNREISDAVHVSEGTVKNYVSRIFWKIDARNRIHAVLIAQELF